MLSTDDVNTAKFLTREPLCGGAASKTLPKERFDEAEAVITSWEGYAPTPLFDMKGLATALNLSGVYYKHEGPRFGLGSFKALGGAYAVLRVIQRRLSERADRPIDLAEITSGRFADQVADMTIISATDGNHGRSVAWGARRFGAQCRIYIHADVSAHRAGAMRDLGAEIIRVDGNYDDTVRQTRLEADRHGWMIVSDTSWPGYTRAPLDVMAGYGVMAREIVQSLPGPPTHVFLQGGVGGFAAAMIAVFKQEWGGDAPRNIVVEPDLAPCLYASAEAGAWTAIKPEDETIMAGLSCGEPSRLAWDVLSDTVQGFMTIPDSVVGPAVRLLANGACGDGPIEAGESAVAGLAGLICCARRPDLRERAGLAEGSRVLLLGSEGVTDPDVIVDLLSGSFDNGENQIQTKTD